METKELIKRTLEIASLFRKEQLRPWPIEALIIELSGEVGTLSDTIMIKEEYRKPRNDDDIDLEDDISDILFILILIASYYDIDIEDAYKRMLSETKLRLIKNIQD